MAALEINRQSTGDPRFPVTETNTVGQSARGLRLPVAAPEIVLAIAADPKVTEDMIVPVDVLEFSRALPESARQWNNKALQWVRLSTLLLATT